MRRSFAQVSATTLLCADSQRRFNRSGGARMSRPAGTGSRNLVKEIRSNLKPFGGNQVSEGAGFSSAQQGIKGPRRKIEGTMASGAGKRAVRGGLEGVTKESWTVSDTVSAGIKSPFGGFSSGGATDDRVGRMADKGQQRQMPVNPQMILQQETPTKSRKRNLQESMGTIKRSKTKDPRLLNPNEDQLKKMVDYELSKPEKKGIRWIFYRLGWRFFRNFSATKVQTQQYKFAIGQCIFAGILALMMYYFWSTSVYYFKLLPRSYRQDLKTAVIDNGYRIGDMVALAQQVDKEHPNVEWEYREFLMATIDKMREEGVIEKNWYNENRNRWPSLMEGDPTHFAFWTSLYFGVAITGGGELLEDSKIAIIGWDVAASRAAPAASSSSSSDVSDKNDAMAKQTTNMV